MNGIKNYFRDLSYWLWFTLGISLLPIAFRIWHLYGNGDNKTFIDACHESTASGDLLLICMALVGGSVAELINGETKFQGTRAVLVGTCVLIAVWAGMVYSDITEGQMIIEKTFSVSLGTLMATILLCSSSLTLPKEII